MDSLSDINDYFDTLTTRVKTDDSFSRDVLIGELQTKSDEVLQELRNSDDVKVYSILFNGLAIIVAILLTIVVFKYGNFWNILVIVGMILYLIYYRSSLMNSYKEVVDHPWIKAFGATKDPVYLPKKLDYIATAAMLKSERIQLTRTFYVLFFPFLILYDTWLYKGELVFSTWFLSYIVAFVIGGLIWYFVFEKDLRELSDLSKNLIKFKYKILK